MPNDNDFEIILKCRCADCDTAKKRGCNSTRLRTLLGNLFEEEPSAETLTVLYCRRKTKGEIPKTEEGFECLCAECELATGEGSHFCSGK